MSYLTLYSNKKHNINPKIYDGNAAVDMSHNDRARTQPPLRLYNKSENARNILRRYNINTNVLLQITPWDRKKIPKILEEFYKKCVLGYNQIRLILTIYISMVTEELSKRNLPVEDTIEELIPRLTSNGLNLEQFFQREETVSQEELLEQEITGNCYELLEIIAPESYRNQSINKRNPLISKNTPSGGFNIIVNKMKYLGYNEKIKRILEIFNRGYVNPQIFRKVPELYISKGTINGYTTGYFFSEEDLNNILSLSIEEEKKAIMNGEKPKYKKKADEYAGWQPEDFLVSLLRTDEEPFPKQSDDHKGDTPKLNKSSNPSTTIKRQIVNQEEKMICALENVEEGKRKELEFRKLCKEKFREIIKKYKPNIEIEKYKETIEQMIDTEIIKEGETIEQFVKRIVDAITPKSVKIGKYKCTLIHTNLFVTYISNGETKIIKTFQNVLKYNVENNVLRIKQSEPELESTFHLDKLRRDYEGKNCR